ncbi:MAG TPA: HEAT repeat domain-containing protein, partial [Chlamydiales bacterium]|nr:HEAT repeat domain-containing protein [Chlamydiales bacterium]
MKKYFFALLLLNISCVIADSPQDFVRRTHSYLLLEDANGAIKEVERGLKEHPGDRGLEIARIKAVASLGSEKRVLPLFWEFVKKREKDPQLNELLEEISWGVLRKASQSSQYTIRLYSLLGAFLTHDARAVKIMQEMMRESNAILRANAVRMASTYLDGPLEEEMLRLIATEKVWFVRMELIGAIGRMRLKEKAHLLEDILAKDSLLEEKGAAIQALVQMYEGIDLEKIFYMAVSERAAFRQVAAHAALFFDIKEAKDVLLPLLYDPRPDVRVSVLNALGLLFHTDMGKEELKALLQHSLADLDPAVAITASWILMLCDPAASAEYFENWLSHEDIGIRLMAASALAKTGIAGADFALKMFEESKEPLVRINLAVGLIGHKKSSKKCLDEIYSFLHTEKKQVMVAADKNPLFPVIAHSHVNVREDIPNFPEAVDQM